MAEKLKRKPAARRDREDARRLQAAGTHGDTVLAHINPQEAGLLDLLADGVMDGGGRNPTSGLLSFGMSDGESGGFGGSSGTDSNPGGVGGGPAGGQTGGGLGGNTSDGQGGLGGGYGGGYAGSANQRAAQALGDYYRDTYINGMVDTPYAAKDTWTRVMQEYFNPSVPQSKYGPTTGTNLGIMGAVMSQLAGGPMSAAMGIGAAMGRAQSPAEQAASMAHNQALGGMNSTGQDRQDGFGSAAPGAASGSAGLLALEQPGASSGSAVPAMDPGGVGATPALGLLGGSDSGAHTKTGLPQPVENLLMDYIWRGRQGTGFGW